MLTEQSCYYIIAFMFNVAIKNPFKYVYMKFSTYLK
jgi:hypothetical protein